MNPNLLAKDNPIVLEQLDWSKISNSAQSHLIFNAHSPDLFKDRPQSELEQIHEYTEYYIIQIIEHALNQTKYEFTTHLTTENPRKLLSLLQKKAYLELSDLNDIALIIETHFLLKDHQLDCYDFDYEFNDINRSFLKDFRRIVSADGSFDYLRHPKIKELFIQKKKLESEIRESLKYLQGDSNWKNILQYEGHDFINDYYVIAVKSDSYRTDLGKIVARSESKNTLFIAPYNTLSKSHELSDINTKIEQIIYEWSRDQLDILIKYYDTVKILFENFLHFDLLQARSNFALNYKLYRPSIADDFITLKGYYHPLLSDPVLNDLELPKDKSGLIISGPNTGGKSITLKTLALSSLFIKKGFFTPAKKTQIPLYDKIFYLSLDGQNLEDGVSSFASEVRSFYKIIEEVGDKNLIIIDEIFNSTSSEEASSLAMGLFNYLLSLPQMVHIVCSTHHQTLKTLIHENKSFQSAHVGFDIQEHRPTYKLHFGTPGSSHALEIFENLTGTQTWSKIIVNKAKQYADNHHINYEKLLTELGRKEKELSTEIDKYHELNKDLKNQKESMQGLIKLKIQDEVKIFKQKLDKKSQKVQQLIQRLKNNEKVSKAEINKTLAKAQEGLNQDAAFQPNRPGNKESIDKPIIGECYFCALTNSNVTVLKINHKKQTAEVGKGAIKLNCHYNDLFPTNNKNIQDVKVSFEKKGTSKMEHDCRGMRLNEFQDYVENHIVDLLSSAVPFVTFIHGHGTGALKSWLRTFVKNHPDLVIEDSETGNDGETRIVLRN
jgi:DNA mismatch repair protein MutS2